jgi:hypothetical protein
MASVSRFLTDRLKLKVNEAKSAVARPEERSFLGFSISNDGSERRIAPKALAKFKARIRKITRRTRGKSLPQIVGWRSYFGFCQTPRVLTNLEAWIRRRLRMYLWRQWKNGPKRFKELRREASRSSLPRLPPVRRRGAGACQDIRRFKKHRATTSSALSAYPDSILHHEAQPTRTAEVRDPYARWCGRGGAVRHPPIPIVDP